jgi:hypothetical protein
MKTALRWFMALALSLPGLAQAQAEDAVILIAHPAFRDIEYRQTVLVAAPVPSGGHVGVILNRPTRRSLGSLFPEHEPSKKVVDPVYYGGPFSRGALVALVRADSAPGAGSVMLMKNQHHRPRHRGDAERGALLRRLRRLAAGRAEGRDRPRPVVGAERRARHHLPQGHRRPVGRAAAAVQADSRIPDALGRNRRLG